MHSNDVVMARKRAEKRVVELEDAADLARAAVLDLVEAENYVEFLEALIAEAAQVEGPLSADLRERMADAVLL